MTFLTAPWAVDGALINSSLARLATYASLGGAEGILQKADLKVSALSTPGHGLQIAVGGVAILNRYQDNPDQAYVAYNPTVHTMNSAEMPASNASARQYLVCTTIGDPEFSQVGHPWMLASDPPAGQENTFVYVRPFLVGPVPAGTKKFSELGLDYPAYALARLEIPANTTTYTNDMIIDLRKLARPRSWEAIAHVAGPGTANPLNGAGGTPGDYERWPNVNVLTVEVPEWAVAAKITGFVEGAKLTKAGQARLRAAVSGTALVTPVTNIDEATPGSSADRRSYNIGGELDIRTQAGNTVTFIVEGTPNNTASKGALTTDSATSVQIRVYFEEVAT